MLDIPRDPGEKVLRELRQEVGFSCPLPSFNGVGRCGNPYLTWHHFDPPWNEKHHHNPEGMIALCLDHHKRSDSGAYTKEQLRYFKEQASCQNAEIKGKFEWMRYDLLVVVGGSFYYKTPTVFQLRENRIIWFERDERGYLLLNIDLAPISSKPMLRMTNNFWKVLGNPADIVCPPSGNKIHIKYKNGDYLMIKFHKIESASKFQRKYSHVNWVPDFPFPLVAAEINMAIREINLKLIPTKSMLNTGTFIGVIFEDCPIAIHFK